MRVGDEPLFSSEVLENLREANKTEREREEAFLDKLKNGFGRSSSDGVWDANGTEIRIQENTPPNSTHSVKVYTDGNAQINTGKVDTYIRGNVELDVKATTSRIEELKNIRKISPESFTKNMKRELQTYKDKLHNYQRSQEMSKTLNNAGINETIENNQMIVENLLDAAKRVEEEKTEVISYIEGVNGKVQIASRWKILSDGTPYLATVILKPVK